MGAERYYKPDYEDGISRGGAFKELAKEMLDGLSASPSKAAAELLMRLNGRIANLSHATFAECAALPGDFWREFHAKDLTKASKTGRTNDEGMRLLFYHLLVKAGFPVFIAKVPDRDFALFDAGFFNLWQFDRDFIGVEEPGAGIVWFDPALRFGQPGLLPIEFTGVPAFVIDTRTWKGKPGSIGAISAGSNIRKYQYQLTLEEESDDFKVDGDFSGYPEHEERFAFMAQDAKEQRKLLKERFENAMKAMKVNVAEVRHTSEAKANVAWHVEGSLERESGRQRILDPFPGMPWPLWVPSAFEESRTVPIVLPYAFTQLAIATFKVPEGFTVEPHEQIKKQNAFGRVFWLIEYDKASRTGKVVLRAEVTTLSAPPTQWDDFRTYLGWIEEACRKQVVLSRES
jgi:hypothetical protein